MGTLAYLPQRGKIAEVHLAGGVRDCGGGFASLWERGRRRLHSCAWARRRAHLSLPPVNGFRGKASCQNQDLRDYRIFRILSRSSLVCKRSFGIVLARAFRLWRKMRVGRIEILKILILTKTRASGGSAGGTPALPEGRICPCMPIKGEGICRSPFALGFGRLGRLVSGFPLSRE